MEVFLEFFGKKTRLFNEYYQTPPHLRHLGPKIFPSETRTWWERGWSEVGLKSVMWCRSFLKQEAGAVASTIFVFFSPRNLWEAFPVSTHIFSHPGASTTNWRAEMLVGSRTNLFWRIASDMNGDLESQRDDEYREKGGGPLGWRAPSCFTPQKNPLKGYIPNKYPLYKVYMVLIIKGPPSQGYHHFPYEWKIFLSKWMRQTKIRVFRVGIRTHEQWPRAPGHLLYILDFTTPVIWGSLGSNIRIPENQPV